MEEILYKGKCNKCGGVHVAGDGEQSVYTKNRIDPCMCGGEITYSDIESRIYKNNKLLSKKKIEGKEIKIDGENFMGQVR